MVRGHSNGEEYETLLHARNIALLLTTNRFSNYYGRNKGALKVQAALGRVGQNP
jgi:hypothetical protein